MSTQQNGVSDVAATSSKRALKKAEPVKEQYKSTKLCKFFLAGACKRGTACTFAHSKDQMKKLPDYAKTRLCEQFHRTGYCENGAACKFAHGKEEMQRAAMERKLKTQAAQENNDVKDAVVPGQQLIQSPPQWVGPMFCQVALQPMMMQGVQFIPVAAPPPVWMNEMQDVGPTAAITNSAIELAVSNPGSTSPTPFPGELDKVRTVAEVSDASTEDQLPCLDVGSTTSTPRTDMPRQLTEEKEKEEECVLSPIAEQPFAAMHSVIDGVQVVVKNGFIHVEESDTDADSEASLVRTKRRTRTMPARLGGNSGINQDK